MDATPHLQSLRGKRYIAYARCASKQGSTQCLRRQIRVIRQFADRLNMRCVDEVRCPGINGLIPRLRWELRSLLDRKKSQNDFDVLVMEDPARLTRADGGMRIEALFALCGVRIIYVTTCHPEATTMSQPATRPSNLRRGSSRGHSTPGKATRARSR